MSEPKVTPAYTPPEPDPDEFPSVVEALAEFDDPDRLTSAFAQQVAEGRARRALAWATSRP